MKNNCITGGFLGRPGTGRTSELLSIMPSYFLQAEIKWTKRNKYKENKIQVSQNNSCNDGLGGRMKLKSSLTRKIQ